MNYNTFHLKNKKTQNKPINEDNFTYQTIISLIRKYFTNKERIVDFGCGVGTIDLYLSSKGFEVVGIDISKRAIDLAQESSKKMAMLSVRFICDDLSLVKYDKEFGYFICSEVLEHCPSDKKVIQNMQKSIRKGGYGIISVPSKNAPLYRMGLLDKFDESVGHLRRYDLATIKKLLENAGFRIIKTVKTEGLLRNLMYTHEYFGWMVRFVKFPLKPIVNAFDSFLVSLFGESNIYIVVEKE